MQIYQGMDIGTAKPTQEEQSLIPHHMINIAQPHEEYTISQFQIEAKEAIAEIESRSVRPLLVCLLYTSPSPRD